MLLAQVAGLPVFDYYFFVVLENLGFFFFFPLERVRAHPSLLFSFLLLFPPP